MKLNLIILTVASMISCTNNYSAQEVSYEKQKIDLPGVNNARQLGGYKIGKKTVKDGVLLRTAALNAASDQAIEALESTYHLEKIFDFRTSFERDIALDREVEGCECFWLPCLEKIMAQSSQNPMFKNFGKDPEKLVAVMAMPEVKAFADAMYPNIVFDDAAQQSYRTFFDELVSMEEGRAALWHCSQGKDRCGWASAFVLAALGADRDLIVKDFALSNQGYQQTIDQLSALVNAKGLGEDTINNIYALIGVSVTNFEATLDQIDQKYGSLDNYMKNALQITDEERTILKSKFLSE